jgi:hypothetical protein
MTDVDLSTLTQRAPKRCSLGLHKPFDPTSFASLAWLPRARVDAVVVLVAPLNIESIPVRSIR